jgi:hypothetical protein
MDVAVVEHGMPLPIVEGFGLGVGTTSNGLTPALPISTEPNGIPVRGRPPGDAGDVAALLVELVAQAPDIAALPGSDVPVPVPVPPPSKTYMDTNTLLIIIVLVLLLGGGGWYGRGRWF